MLEATTPLFHFSQQTLITMAVLTPKPAGQPANNLKIVDGTDGIINEGSAQADDTGSQLRLKDVKVMSAGTWANRAILQQDPLQLLIALEPDMKVQNEKGGEHCAIQSHKNLRAHTDCTTLQVLKVCLCLFCGYMLTLWWTFCWWLKPLDLCTSLPSSYNTTQYTLPVPEWHTQPYSYPSDCVDQLHFQFKTGKDSTPYHKSILSSQWWVLKLITGHPNHICCDPRVRKKVFLQLLTELCQADYQDSKRVTFEKQVVIFLYTCMPALTVQHVGEHFQCSSDTISWYLLML